MAFGRSFRRWQLGGAVLAIGAATFLADTGCGPSAGSPLPQADADASVPAQAGCVVGAGSARERTQHVAVSDSEGALTFDVIPNADGRRTQILDIRVGSETLVHMETEPLPDGRAHLRATFGPAQEGIRTAELWSDQKFTTGTLDGRPIEPLAAGEPVSAIRFADTHLPPTVSLREGIVPTAASLVERMKGAASSCGGAQPANGPPRPLPSRPLEASYDGNSTNDDPRNTIGCIACGLSCDAGWVGCMYGFATGCAAAGPFYLVCLGVGFVLCSAGWATCVFVVCEAVACCPEPCGGGAGGACCARGHTCLGTGGQCCSQGTHACVGHGGGADQSCCKGDDACMTNGRCCPLGHDVCNGTECCDANANCLADHDGTRKRCQECDANTGGIICTGSGKCCIAGQENCIPPQAGGANDCCTNKKTCADAITNQPYCCPGGQQCVHQIKGQDTCCNEISACDTFCCGNDYCVHSGDGSQACCTPDRFCGNAAQAECCNREAGEVCLVDSLTPLAKTCCKVQQGEQACGAFCCHPGQTCGVGPDKQPRCCGVDNAACGGNVCCPDFLKCIDPNTHTCAGIP